jgi:guanylate kinase
MELDENLKRKITGYKPELGDLEPIRDTPILFVVGISGAGKDTILQRLMALHPDRFRFIVSHTTRKPRENHGVVEQDGIDYHFVDPQTIGRLLDERAFIEAKLYADNIYGTTVAEIEKAKEEDKIAFTDVTVDGADEYVELGLNVKNVFLLPPSYEVWQERLLNRYEGNVHQHDFYKRMKTALNELEHALNTDHFYIVINDELDKTVELVSQIAHGEPHEPHYHKAVAIAEQIADRIRQKIAELE